MRKLLLFLSVFLVSTVAFLSMMQSVSDIPRIAAMPERLPRGVGSLLPVAGQDAPEIGEGGIVLKTQDICEVGELIRLDARESDVDSLTWQVLPFTEDFEVVDDGLRAFLSARFPGQFLVIVAGAKNGHSFLQHKMIIVEGDEIPGPSTLTQQVTSWVNKVENYEGKAAKGQALAEVFRDLAMDTRIDVAQILEATALANTAVLGNDLERWVPFLVQLEGALDALVESGGLQTRDDYRNTWLAIAKGIERAVR